MIKSFDDIAADVKAGKIAPVYFLHGEEGYFIDKISDLLERSVLPESEQSFNQSVIYGKDVDHLTVLDYVRRYPMMSARQVVILKEAQHMKSLEKLESYIENPMATTVFVICYKHKSFDKRKVFYKKVLKQSVVLESPKLKDDKVPAFIKSMVQKSGFAIGPEATQLLAEYLGSDLGRVENELQKLSLNLQNKTITTDDIERDIGISKDFNVFELQKAIGAKDKVKALRITQYFTANPKNNPFVVTSGVLFAFFQKIYMAHLMRLTDNKQLAAFLKVNPYFISDYKVAMNNYNRNKTEEVIGVLHEFDLRSKGVGTTSVREGELLKELVFRIMNN